jgi:hypothetical protein
MAVICGTPAPVTTRVVQIDPGPMPTFSPSMPSAIKSRAPSAVATFPASSSMSGNLCFTCANGIHHARRVPVRSVDRQASTFTRAISSARSREIACRSDGGAHAQAPLLILGGVREFELLLDVLYGDETLQIEILVHHEKLFDAVRAAGFVRLLRAWCRPAR